jgi:ABC-type multidrug transport system fused ATPase/permease subunit
MDFAGHVWYNALISCRRLEVQNNMSETIVSFFTHPYVMAVLAVAGGLLVFFLIKKFIKLALILIITLIVGLALYYGITTPGDYKEKMKGAVEKTKAQSGELIKKGKDKIVEKGKKLTEDLGKKPLEDKKKFFESRSKTAESE